METKITVRSNSGHDYTITLTDGSPTWCTCPAYRFAKGPSKVRTCKHVQALLDAKVGVKR